MVVAVTFPAASAITMFLAGVDELGRILPIVKAEGRPLRFDPPLERVEGAGNCIERALDLLLEARREVGGFGAGPVERRVASGENRLGDEGADRKHDRRAECGDAALEHSAGFSTAQIA